MHKIGWKENYFKSTDVSMLGHGCVVSKFPQLYDKIKKISIVTTSIGGKLF